MSVRIGRKIINTDNIVDADVFEPGKELPPYWDGYAEWRTGVVTTRALETTVDRTPGSRRIWLEGEGADLFLVFGVFPKILSTPRKHLRDQGATWVNAWDNDFREANE